MYTIQSRKSRDTTFTTTLTWSTVCGGEKIVSPFESDSLPVRVDHFNKLQFGHTPY